MIATLLFKFRVEPVGAKLKRIVGTFACYKTIEIVEQRCIVGWQ